MKHSTICLVSALGGAVVGAAIAMLVTPQSGKELRAKIRGDINEAKCKIREELDHAEGCGCGCGSDDE